MKQIILSSLIALALVAGGVTTGAAHEFKAGELTIDHPWARASIGNAPNSAGYMVIKNDGSSSDTLESASSPVAAKTELHTHIKEGNIMKMRPVTEGVSVPANAETKFQPGGLHVMLMGLKQKLGEGDIFPVTLKFRKAGEVTVEFKVEKPKTDTTGGHKHHH